MLVRDEARTGLKSVSLQDGTIISTMSELHKKPITQFLMMHNNSTVITASKDKTIIVTDMLSKTVIKESL